MAWLAIPPASPADSPNKQLPPPFPTPSVTRQKLIVGLTVNPPFVIHEPNGSWSGISIELWQQVAKEIGLNYEYREMASTLTRRTVVRYYHPRNRGPPAFQDRSSRAHFGREKESTGNDQQVLGGGPARALIDQVKSATGMQRSQVVDLMSSSLVSDLNRGGVKAQRLAAGQSLPKNGWLVRGIFTEVEQGSRILRSQVGFGAGATDLAVLVNVSDLKRGKPESFYRLETQAGSRKMPGAAPMAIVTKNPYVAAAKFVMSRRDLPKNIRQTAQTIADQIIRWAGRPT
jgi:Domain of unknown function (DUF4410)/Bacterial extracellular solute-binding proteins, family 3